MCANNSTTVGASAVPVTDSNNFAFKVVAVKTIAACAVLRIIILRVDTLLAIIINFCLKKEKCKRMLTAGYLQTALLQR